MPKFSVYHPKDGSCNHSCNKDLSFIRIVTIEAKSKEHAFGMTQNDLSKSYATLGKRSTSVGDIVLDHSTGRAYIIKGIGFEEVNFVPEGLPTFNHTS